MLINNIYEVIVCVCVCVCVKGVLHESTKQKTPLVSLTLPCIWVWWLATLYLHAQQYAQLWGNSCTHYPLTQQVNLSFSWGALTNNLEWASDYCMLPWCLYHMFDGASPQGPWFWILKHWEHDLTWMIPLLWSVLCQGKHLDHSWHLRLVFWELYTTQPTHPLCLQIMNRCVLNLISLQNKQTNHYLMTAADIFHH